MRARLALTLLAAGAVACSAPYGDASQSNGDLVGEEMPSCAEWAAADDPAYCVAIVAFAWSQVGQEGPITDQVRLFRAPLRDADGTLIVRGAGPVYVVFERPDGRQRVVPVMHPSDETLLEFGYPGPRPSP